MEEALSCLRNLNDAVRRSYEVIHERSKKAKVGVAHNCAHYGPQDSSGPSQRSFASEAEEVMVDYPAESWEGKFDYFGINYYGNQLLADQGRSVEAELHPEGLREFCKTFFERYRKPILITENGLPNRDDRQKTAYLLLHLKNIQDAISVDNAEVLGYCYWSFLHGYEWGMGYEPFFALVDVDIGDTYKRTPTRTAHVYRDIIKNRGFSEELYDECAALKSSLKFEEWL